MNLHDVKLPGLVTALVWGYARGGNGRMLGGRLIHAYPATRQTPDRPLGHRNRRFWGPWGLGVFYGKDPLTPLCGRLRSNARFAQIMSTYKAWDADLAPRNACPDCVRIGHGNIRYLDDVQKQDPWTTVPYDLRIDTPDPVTGL